MTWWMWTILALVWVLSLLGAYILGGRRITGLVLKELSNHLSAHDKFMSRWIRTNQKYVHDVAHNTLGDDASVRQLNIKILADNRRLRAKLAFVACRYGAVARTLKTKPARDGMSLILDYVWAMARHSGYFR